MGAAWAMPKDSDRFDIDSREAARKAPAPFDGQVTMFFFFFPFAALALIGAHFYLYWRLARPLPRRGARVAGGAFIGLRGDYGSSWRGDFIVRNCTFAPRKGRKTAAVTLVNGASTDWHDFGYACFMPRRVVFDGLVIDDSGLPENYEGPFVFGMFNEKNTSSGYVEKHPYHVTEEVELRNVKVTRQP